MTYSDSSLKVRQGGDKRATKTVQVARLGASAEANEVSLIKWNWNYSAHSKRIVIIAGPNGAGKVTFAREFCRTRRTVRPT